MYTPTQYIAAAINDLIIDPEALILRIENKHKADTPEIGIDQNIIYTVAKAARSRKYWFNFFLVLPGFYIASKILKMFESYYYSWEDLIGDVIFSIISIAIILYIEQLVKNKAIRECINIKNTLPKEDNQNLIISGGYSPFLGYGHDLDSWSFVTNLRKPIDKQNPNIKALSVNSLLSFITQQVKDSLPEAKFSAKFFVNGCDIRNTSEILPHITAKPNIVIESRQLAIHSIQNASPIRKYTVIEIPIWENHINFSLFIRSSIKQDNLYTEARYFLLPPISSEYMILDSIFARRGFTYHYKIIWLSLLKATVAWLRGPLQIFSWIGKGQTNVAWLIFGNPEDKIKQKNTNYNYGHTSSIRESFAKPNYHRYFQMLDKDQVHKTLQSVVITAIVDHLEAHGISTEDIKQRQEMILNSGVIVNGGTINTENMAIGNNANIIKRVMTKAGSNKD